jgi:hypothetical protein
MGIINYVQKYIFRNNLNEDVAEEFTAEVNQDLRAQLKEKDKEISKLKQIISDFSAEVFLSTVSALDKLSPNYVGDEDESDEFEEEEE